MKNNNGILIFNNGGMDLGLVSAMLEAEDCTVYVTSLPLEAIHILRNSNIDVILASSRLDGMEGQEFKELAEKIRPGVSIFLLPAQTPPRVGVLREISSECTLNLKEFVYFIQNHIRNEKNLIDEASRFKEFFFAFTDRMLQIFEVNDKYFFNNDHLVADLSHRIALKMGLEEKLVDAIHLAALLRDIGKIGMQNAILGGNSRLAGGDLERIKSHPLNTVQILKQIKFPWNVDSIIRHHHEQYDGNGYPDGLKGRNIPLGSRIIAIADSYVAMTTDRSYRKALTETEACQEIMKLAGSQFDSEVAEVFFAVLHEQKSREHECKTLLVVEPDESLSAYLRLNLHGDEFDLQMTDTAEEAAAYLKKKKPALIIADEDVLQGDGYRLYAAIRQQQSIPVIMVVERENLAGHHGDGLLGFVTKPVDAEELAQKVRSLCRHETPRVSAQTADESPRGVSGTLEDMGITDIIQVLNMGMKTARVILLKGGERGEIYLKSGKITYVECGDLYGSEAFFELIGWSAGEFRIFHGQITDKVNVTMETVTLLLEATKALDEKRHEPGRESAT